MTDASTAAVILGSYALGSCSFAVLVSRVLRLGDPRSYGSGNPGATNVLRSGNKLAAALTLALDAAKGGLPVAWLAHTGWPIWVVAAAGMAAFLGHLYPVFFRFAGGKGVATALGVMLGISGWLGLCVLLTWALVAAFFRYSSLAALVAAAAAPVYFVLGVGTGVGVLWPLGWADRGPFVALLCAMAAGLAWRHRANVLRLWRGLEPRIGQRMPPGTGPLAPPPTDGRAP